MTELEIINAMLAAVGSNGVTSTIGRHPALIKATPILNHVNLQIQNRGHWYNTDFGLTLSPDVDGEFILPQATLRADTSNKKLRYVRRGRRMYDPYNQTYEIAESTIDVDVVLELEYDLLPFVVWDHIRAKAVWRMLINAEADQITLQAAARDVEETKQEYERERLSQKDASLRDNPEYAFIMAGMPRMASRQLNPDRIGG